MNGIRILKNSWSEIWFVFDIKRDRLFLKDIVDFYGNFKRLTKGRFELLSSDIADTTKNEFKMQIENVVIETNVGNVANINFRKDINLLTKYYQEILLGVDDIY